MGMAHKGSEAEKIASVFARSPLHFLRTASTMMMVAVAMALLLATPAMVTKTLITVALTQFFEVGFFAMIGGSGVHIAVGGERREETGER